MDGIPCGVKDLTRVEPLISVAQLKERYLFGVIITDDNGNEIKEETFQSYIDTAVSMFEHDLDICIFPRTFTEYKDYHANDYWQWSYFQLNNIPIIDVTEVRAVYPNSTILRYPKAWNKLQHHDGLLRLIPTAGTMAQFMVDGGGSYLPEIFRYQGMVPLVWEIDYKAGFEEGKVPVILNAAIGLIAAIFALNIAGDLILGAGIASSSISIDGLSQSIATTASAENHGYSSKVDEYYRLLWGSKTGQGSKDSSQRGIVAMLRDYYQGQRMAII